MFRIALALLYVLEVANASAQEFVNLNTNGATVSQPSQATNPPSRIKVKFMGEAGWRWVALGQARIPRNEDTFSMAFHGGLRLDIGGPNGGFYSYARFDGYAPTGLSTFPWQAQLRAGFFINTQYWDSGGLQSSTSTQYTGSSCGYATCYDHYVERTSTWWEPAGWVNGLRYFYAAGHLVSGTEVQRGSSDTQYAGAVGLGLGIVETKFATWFAETELLYFPGRQWVEEDRSDWGWSLRGGSLFGPVFIDMTLLLDPAIGGELSIGLGVLLGG